MKEPASKESMDYRAESESAYGGGERDPDPGNVDVRVDFSDEEAGDKSKEGENGDKPDEHSGGSDPGSRDIRPPLADDSERFRDFSDPNPNLWAEATLGFSSDASAANSEQEEKARQDYNEKEQEKKPPQEPEKHGRQPPVPGGSEEMSANITDYVKKKIESRSAHSS